RNGLGHGAGCVADCSSLGKQRAGRLTGSFGARRFGNGLRHGRRVALFVQADAPVQPSERGGQPPGTAAEQPQGGGEEQAAYEYRVEEDGEGGADAEDLQDDDVRGAEDADRDREEDRGRGDDAANGGDTAADRLAVGAALQPGLAYPAE